MTEPDNTSPRDVRLLLDDALSGVDAGQLQKNVKRVK
jgi:hypothetical protein